jgi:Na+/H+ antiporter NhaD/arsenite permease-like protein
MTESVEHTILFDYIPFIILLGGLYIVTGGIFINSVFDATPKNNTIILAVGGLLASFMGTTGAAMLLIRLLLQTNKQRQYKVHNLLFFIAVVANCGGVLKPLGDPPLFMMYLRGVDFF